MYSSRFRVLILVMSMAVSVFAADIYVDPVQGVDTNPGSSAQPVLSISRAISLITGQTGTIHLLTGTHTAGKSVLTIPDGVAVKGAGMAQTIVSKHLVFSNHSGTVSLSDLHIEGGSLTIEFCPSAVLSRCKIGRNPIDAQYAIQIRNTDITFSNCFITNLYANWILEASGQGDMVFDGTTFEFDASDDITSGYSHSVNVWSCRDLTFRNCHFILTDPSGGSKYEPLSDPHDMISSCWRFLVHSSRNVLISGCSMAVSHVEILRAENTTATSNTLQRGAEISGAGRVTYTGNTLDRGQLWADANRGCTADNSSATGNQFTNGSLFGYLTVTGNTFSSSRVSVSGEVNGNQFVDSSCTIASGTVFIRGNTFSGTPPWANAGSSIIILYSGLVEDNTIEAGFANGIYAYSAGGAIVKGNRISGTGRNGVWGARIVQDNTVTGFQRGVEECEEALNNRVEAPNWGIRNAQKAIGNTVSGGEAKESGARGIDVQYLAEGNTVTGSFSCGINAGTIINNRVTGFTEYGIIWRGGGLLNAVLGCTVTGSNRTGMGILGTALHCTVSNCETGIWGNAENCNVTNCTTGIMAISYDVTQPAKKCIVRDCDKGFSRGQYQYNAWIVDSEITGCVTGAERAENCRISDCALGAVEAIRCTITNCDIGCGNAIYANLIEGCGIGAQSINPSSFYFPNGNRNIFRNNNIGLDGTVFRGTGYNLFENNGIGVRGVLRGDGTEKHNDFIGNGIGVYIPFTGSTAISLDYRYNYWGSAQGPTVNPDERRGDSLEVDPLIIRAVYSVSPWDTSPNVTGDPDDPPETRRLRIDLTVTPLKGPAPLAVRGTVEVEGGVPPYSYEWFVGGEAAPSGSASLSRSLSSQGTHHIQVQVTDSEGEIATDSCWVEVNNTLATGMLIVYVSDVETGEWLGNSLIDLQGSDQGMNLLLGNASSNGTGHFSNVPVGTLRVRVQAVGYQEWEGTVGIKRDVDTHLYARLTRLHGYQKKRELIARLEVFPTASKVKPLAVVEARAAAALDAGLSEEAVNRLGLVELAAWTGCGEAETLSTEIASSIANVLAAIIEAKELGSKLRNGALDKLPESLRSRGLSLLNRVDGKLDGIFGQFVRFAVQAAPGRAGSQLRADVETAALKFVNKTAGTSISDLLKGVIADGFLRSFCGEIEGTLSSSIQYAEGGIYSGDLEAIRGDMRDHLRDARERTMALANDMATATSIRGLTSGLADGSDLVASILTYTGVGKTFTPWVIALENVSKALTYAADGWTIGVAGYRMFREIPSEVEDAQSIAYGFSSGGSSALLAAVPNYRMTRAMSSTPLLDSATALTGAITTYRNLLKGNNVEAVHSGLESSLLAEEESFSHELNRASTQMLAILSAQPDSEDDTARSIAARLETMEFSLAFYLLNALSMAENFALYREGTYDDFPEEFAAFETLSEGIITETLTLAESLANWLSAHVESPVTLVLSSPVASPSSLQASPMEFTVSCAISNLADTAVEDIQVKAAVLHGEASFLSPSTVPIGSLEANGTVPVNFSVTYTGPAVAGSLVIRVSVFSEDESIYLPEPCLLFLYTNPYVDTDGDGMSDEFENLYDLDPLDPADALEDPDEDGLPNIEEFLRGTKPRLADTDGDGLLDGEEVHVYFTDPLNPDTDGGGASDGYEVLLSLDPLDPDDDASLAMPTPWPTTPPPAPTPQPDPGMAYFIEELALSIDNHNRKAIPLDISGDGDTDFIFISTTYGPQQALINKGSGTFQVLSIGAGWWSVRYLDAKIADVDRDGTPEIVGVDSGKKVFYQRASDTYINQPTPVLTEFTAWQLDTVDLDGNSVPDLVVGLQRSVFSSLPTLGFWKNNGTGTFSDVTLDYLEDPNCTSYLGSMQYVTVLDADGDGHPDIFAGSGAEGRFLLFNPETRKFVNQTDRFDRDMSTLRLRNVLAADLNLNGHRDLIVLQGTSHLSNANLEPALYLNDGTNHWTCQGPVAPDLNYEGGALLADLDGDGDMDLVLYGTYQPYPFADVTFRVLINNTRNPVGSGGLFTDVTQLIAGDILKYYIYDTVIGAAVMDINADSIPDLLLVRRNASLLALLGQEGTGLRRWERFFSIGATWLQEPRVGPRLEGDINADGKIDHQDVLGLLGR